MTVAAAFDAVATEYDAACRRLVPCFDGLYGTVLDLIAERGPPRGARVLDLGAGTGLLAARRIAGHKITRIDELLPWRYAAAAA